MNKSKKTKKQIEEEMKDELRKQGVDVDFQDDFGDVYGNDDLISRFKDSKGEYEDDSYEY
tara:strand:+ start:1347 stop:1526 length:180 start_codon:yes stop_codon:yes gene_type:complete